jgi:hypothetical protein
MNIWVQHENTHILLQAFGQYEIPELLPRGYVVLRQVYPTQKPGWSCTVNGRVLSERFDDLDAAKKAVEISLG